MKYHMFVHPAGRAPYLLPRQPKIRNIVGKTKKKKKIIFIIIIKLHKKICVKIKKIIR